MSQTSTTNLQLPLLAAAQAQKHITHNEALLLIDGLMQASVITRGETEPPAEPEDGARYIPASGATGAWADWDLNIAYYVDGVWRKLVPKPGWRVWIADQQQMVVWGGATWAQLAQNVMLFTPGGDGEVSIYRNDETSGENPRAATIESVSGDTITLTTNTARAVFDDDKMKGVSYVRIWNMDKDPVEPAWVAESPASDTLVVLEANDISGWSDGETIQVGDPTDETPGRVMAIDIRAFFGAPFRQSGIMVKAGLQTSAAGDAMNLTPDGSGGSFIDVGRTFASGVFAGVGTAICSCTELSPISNSNLVFLRESISGTGSVRLVSSVAVFR